MNGKLLDLMFVMVQMKLMAPNIDAAPEGEG
jgi:hypothetical protein